MKITKEEYILNTYNDKDQLIKSTSSIAYLIFPDENKYLKNIKNGLLYDGGVSVRNKEAINNYIEVDIPKKAEEE